MTLGFVGRMSELPTTHFGITLPVDKSKLSDQDLLTISRLRVRDSATPSVGSSDNFRHSDKSTPRSPMLTRQAPTP